MNKYDSYKDSGVEWIGEIPSGWETTKMKYGVSHLSEKGKPEKNDIKISPENVESETGVCFNLYSGHDSEGMKFQKGDVLLNKLRLYLKKILFTEYDGYSLGEMIVLRTNNKLNNRYFYQLLFSQGLIDLLDSQSTGIKLPRVSPEVILNTDIIYPPLSEQQQIVSFLDDKTQKIDSLIQQKEKKIELLKEKRTSLINHVVTKGLDSNVEMKDSGVEWIGNIPIGWVVKKVSYLCSQMISGPFGSSLKKEFYTKSGYKIYGQEQVIKDDFEYGDYYVSEEKYQELKRCQIYTDDILVSCVGTFGKISKVPEEFEPGIINPRLLKITPNKLISSNYFLKLLRSNISFSQFELLSRGGTMGVINLDILRRLVFPIPTIIEQQQIVEYLDNQTEEIDTLIQLEQKKIDTLKEYRQSLISEVVTGKIRVCEEDDSLSLNSQTV